MTFNAQTISEDEQLLINGIVAAQKVYIDWKMRHGVSPEQAWLDADRLSKEGHDFDHAELARLDAKAKTDAGK